MPDFGDEMGDAFWRFLQRPFDEYSRVLLRDMMHASRDPRDSNKSQTETDHKEPTFPDNVRRGFNDQGEFDHVVIEYTSREQRALTMDLLDKHGIEHELIKENGSEFLLKIKAEDFQKSLEVINEYDKKIAQDIYSPMMDKSLINYRSCPVSDEFSDFAHEIAATKELPNLKVSLHRLTIGETNDYFTKNREQIGAYISERVLDPTSDQTKALQEKYEKLLESRGLSPQKSDISEPGYDMNDLTQNDARMMPSHDGMDPDNHTQVIEDSWKENMNDAIIYAQENSNNLGEFCDRLRDRGYGVGFTHDGEDLQISRGDAPYLKLNLANSKATITLKDFYGKADPISYAEKAKQSEFSHSKERSLSEIGEKEIPSQQLLTR